MANRLYNPFQESDFSPKKCFLTGQTLQSEEEQIFVFPEWIMDRYSLRDSTFKMLEGGNVKYNDMKIPCLKSVSEHAIKSLDDEIEEAFAAGYDAVKNVPEERLFLWMAKLLYGVLYHDISIEQRKATTFGKEFSLSLFLQERIGKLHSMLQSLVCPMEFRGTKFWSIEVFKIKISKDVFNYKDETNNLNFSLGMNDFGIVACLQDNGAVSTNQQELTDKFSHKTLHPIQFEEFCARFIYANYLLTSYAEYTLQTNEEKVIIESTPLVNKPNKSLFDRWDEDMFAQVLAVYWKPWGITKNEIITLGNSPISYLEEPDTYALVEPDSITLPY